VPEIVFVSVPVTEMEPVCVADRLPVGEMVGRLEGVIDSV